LSRPFDAKRLPQIITGIRIALGVAWRAVVAVVVVVLSVLGYWIFFR
jgi:ABC-type nitrate/sulfonate/bicarbonate transport system permease component